MAVASLERAVRKATGESADVLRGRTLAEGRRLAEAKHGTSTWFRSWFPLIGRGNVLRDCTVTHSQVEAGLDAALADH